MKARILRHDRYVFADGAFVVIKIWKVGKTGSMPEGIKYSLAYADVRRLRGQG